MQTREYTVPSGDGQTLATVGFMRQLARQGAVSPDVRTVAAFIVAHQGRDMLRFANAISGWVGQHTRFLYDPSVAEALVPADQTLHLIAQYGLARVDCDDVAILAAALGLSVGLRARFVVVGFWAEDSPYEHVWAELSDADGERWLAVDHTRPSGGLPPIVRAPLVVEV